MCLLNRVDHWSENTRIFRRDQDDVIDIVDCEKLERVEEKRDISEWKEALCSITAHRFELVVEGLCEENSLHVLALILYLRKVKASQRTFCEIGWTLTAGFTIVDEDFSTRLSILIKKRNDSNALLISN